MAIKNLPVEECMIPGSAACPGCPATMALRITFKALGKNTVMVVPACCTSVIESLYPNTSFNVPVMNIAFEAAAAGASGVEAALISSIYVTTIRYILTQASNGVELPHMVHGLQQPLAVKQNSERRWGRLSKHITYHMLPNHVLATLKIYIIS